VCSSDLISNEQSNNQTIQNENDDDWMDLEWEYKWYIKICFV
jgi:hypothetical protein